jgi:competence protein ComEA
MSAAPSSPPPAVKPAPPAPPSSAWPVQAQLAVAFLLGVAVTLLVVQVLGSLRGGSRPAEATHRINLNQAGRAELLQLPGVGEGLAGRIEEYRDEHGGFRSVDELIHVHGVGKTTLERLRPWLAVEEFDEGEEEFPAPAPRTGARQAGAEKKDKPGGMGAKSGGPSAKVAQIKQPIDVNRATAAELQQLPGIGPKMSQRIIDERAKAPFKSVDELRRVSGIGAKTLEKLKPYITAGTKTVPVVRAD